MSRISTDRTMLSFALNNPKATLLVLFGTAGSKAERVYTTLSNGAGLPIDCFLVEDWGRLDPMERSGWQAAAERYAVLGGSGPAKVVAAVGDVKDLIDFNGNPDFVKIDPILGKGLELP